MKTVAWGKKVSPEFLNKVYAICIAYNWNWDGASSDLMSCMAFESGETFSPSIKNAAGSGATGLIQFMPATAVYLGTTTDALAKMTDVQQLDYVQKYFEPYAYRVQSLSDMYMAILLPKYVGKPDDSVLFTEGNVSYRQNAGLDANNDGKITKAEAASKVLAKRVKGLQDNYALKVN
jgi:hypothetical protein